MTIIHKLIIIGAAFSLVAFSVFLVIKPQIVQAQYAYSIICSPNATQKCVGNSIFWYDSCDKQQTWVKDCFNGCQNGQCINYQSVYTKHYKKSCNNNNVYWYDSDGVLNDLYKTCSDSNECTQDSCTNDQCLNKLKCDGSTCSVGSSDYCSACNSIGDGVCNCGETVLNAPNDCKEQIVPSFGGLDISIFCGIKNNTIDLSKNITVVADQIINCLIIVKNTSASLINDVSVRVDIPEEIISTSQLKIDGMVIDGNITSGINAGNFLPNMLKIIIFEGKTRSLFTQTSAKQITGIASSGAFSSSDPLTINFQPIVANTTTTSLESFSFLEFMKRWYIWILIAIVLIFLFFVIFRRLSSNV